MTKIKMLEFTIEDVKQLIHQGDASYINKNKDDLVIIQRSMYRKYDNKYISVEQLQRLKKYE